MRLLALFFFMSTAFGERAVITECIGDGYPVETRDGFRVVCDGDWLLIPEKLHGVCFDDNGCLSKAEALEVVRMNTPTSDENEDMEAVIGGVLNLTMRFFAEKALNAEYAITGKETKEKVAEGHGETAAKGWLSGFGNTIKEWAWAQMQAQLEQVEEGGVWFKYQDTRYAFGYNRKSKKFVGYIITIVDEPLQPPLHQD